MPDGMPLRVLYIEDSEDDATLVSGVLKRVGYQVHAQRVTTAAALQAALQNSAWDVVIADYSLPQFDAPGALAVLRASGLDLPFIVVSGAIVEEQAVTVLRAGAHDFITKGNLARLGPAIEREMREAANRRQHQAAQQLLREQEASFQLLFDGNPLPMWVYDSETLAFLEVNEAATAHYGYSRAQFLDMCLTGLQPAPDSPPLPAGFEPGSQAGPAPAGHQRHRTRDGRLIDVELAAHTLALRGRPAVLMVATDVTQRTIVERELRASEERFRQFSDNIPQVFWIQDQRAAPQLYVSPAYEAIWGRSRQGLYDDPGSFLDAVHPDDRARFQAGFEQSGGPAGSDSEYRIVRPDRSIRWIRALRFSIPGSDGQLDRLAGIADDVTERKQSEKTILELAAIVESSNDAIIGCTSSGDITSWNSAAQALLGYSAQEVKGRSLSAFQTREQVAALLRGVERLKAGERIDPLEQVWLHKAGRLVPVAASPSLIKTTDGQIIGLSVIARDMTESQRAEAELKRVSAASLRQQRRGVLRELIGLALLAVVVFVAADTFNLFRAFSNWATGLADYFVDDLALTLAIVAPVLLLFSYRRWREARAEIDRRQQVEAALRTLRGELEIRIQERTADLRRANADLASAYSTTLEGWSAALDLRDKETEGHSQRVTQLTLDLARAMGIGAAELEHVRRGALLHDIGKMGIPDAILLKAGPLTDDEWVIMRQHPVYARQLLSPIAYLRPALDIPYCHHEKWDGTGYPRGLVGEQIPVAARLFTIVDVWDALRSDRPYRPAWPDEKVRQHIRALAGTAFEPRLAAEFLRLVSDDDTRLTL